MGMMGAGLRPSGKPLDQPPYPKMHGAPHFYPDRQQRSPVAVIVISDVGDRPAGSPDVKVSDGWSDLVRSVQGGEQTDRP